MPGVDRVLEQVLASLVSAAGWHSLSDAHDQSVAVSRCAGGFVGVGTGVVAGPDGDAVGSR